MSGNKYRPHICVLPEHDADRQIANGFLTNSNVALKSIDTLPIGNGWGRVLEEFLHNHAKPVRRNTVSYFILLFDFDADETRLEYFRNQIPSGMHSRVFMIGTWTEPEKLRSDTKSNLEQLGATLASECFENRRELWNHELLRHNLRELNRMPDELRKLIFNSSGP